MTTDMSSTGDLLLIVRHLVTDSTFCFEIQVGGLEGEGTEGTISKYQWHFRILKLKYHNITVTVTIPYFVGF